MREIRRSIERLLDASDSTKASEASVASDKAGILLTGLRGRGRAYTVSANV